MKRFLVFVLCAIAGAVGLACVVVVLHITRNVLAPNRHPWATVQGTVVDLEGRVPLAGASVACISGAPLSFSAHRDEVTTDALGRFTLPVLQRRFHIEVRKDGYVPVKVSNPDPRQIREIGLTRARPAGL